MASNDVGRADVQQLVAAVVRVALDRLAALHGQPALDVQFDPRSWTRHGQESFALTRHQIWRQPPETYSSEWLESLEEMRSLRMAVRADGVLSQRLDVMVGTEFSRTSRALADVVIYRLLTPMILSTGTYDFDQQKFAELYGALEQALLATRVRWIDFVPINGLVLASGVEVKFPGGLVLREMTDSEIGAALRVLAVPVERHDSPTSITVSRFNQVALALEHDHPFVAQRDMPEHPAVPVVKAVDESAARLATAVRIVCGGSSGATRYLRMMHPVELEANGSSQAHLTELAMIDPERPVVLSSDQTGELLEVFELLAKPVSGALEVALRRLRFAGGRTQAVDRLIDLIVCAEALFIQHLGSTDRSQSVAIGRGARVLLGSDQLLGSTPDAVEAFMRAAYRRRNAEVHGDPSPHSLLINLRGEAAPELDSMVEDLDQVMRRACRLIMNRAGTGEL